MAWYGNFAVLALFVVTQYCIVSYVELWTISCVEENVDTWPQTYYRFYYLDGNGSKCYTKCPTQCTCILGNETVTSECKNRPPDEATIQYSSDVIYYLSWSDSVIHAIKPQAFMTLGDELLGLFLNNVSL